MDALWAEIDSAIHLRKIAHAKRLIQSYVRKNRYSSASRYEVSEFYRRISEYSLALRVLPRE
jgi:hypothetical protein